MASLNSGTVHADPILSTVTHAFLCGGQLCRFIRQKKGEDADTVVQKQAVIFKETFSREKKIKVLQNTSIH
jgi:hypothetical protein